MKAIVYRILNLVTDEFYVGVTTQPLAKRLGQHFASISRSSGPLHSAIAKFGQMAFVIEPLVECETIEIGMAKERRLISALSPAYNVAPGGKGEREVVCLDDGCTFASASAAAAFYKTAKSAVIEVCLRNPRRAQAGGRVFRYVGDIFDANAELATAKKRTMERAGKGAPKLMKPVVCLDDGKVYPSAIEASAAYGIHRSRIGEVCRGVVKAAKGRSFSYEIPKEK